MLAAVQRMAIPELTRVFGQYGLYLRPSAAFSIDLSGNLLANVISLYRDQDRLGGQLLCLDAELPISTASLSLVYALFILETSPEPEALMHEIARSLKPGGVALVISMNPWSLARLCWLFKPVRATSSLTVDRLAKDAGLEVTRRQFIGPFWPNAGSSIPDPRGIHWFDGFRAASLMVLCRRESALTPLRKAASAVSLRPGMSAG